MPTILTGEAFVKKSCTIVTTSQMICVITAGGGFRFNCLEQDTGKICVQTLKTL